MKKIIILLLVVVIKFSSSCDFYTPYHLIIDNQTSDTLKISFLGKSPYVMINPDSLVFPPKHKKVLYEATGAASKDGCYTGIKEDGIKIYISSGKVLQKNIWNVNNWNCNGSFKNGWDMTFVVTENDLE